MVANFSSQCSVQLGGLLWSLSCAIGHLRWNLKSYMFNKLLFFHMCCCCLCSGTFLCCRLTCLLPLCSSAWLGHSSYYYYYYYYFWEMGMTRIGFLSCLLLVVTKWYACYHLFVGSWILIIISQSGGQIFPSYSSST